MGTKHNCSDQSNCNNTTVFQLNKLMIINLQVQVIDIPET